MSELSSEDRQEKKLEEIHDQSLSPITPTIRGSGEGGCGCGETTQVERYYGESNHRVIIILSVECNYCKV